MQVILALFIFGASVVAAAAFPPPPPSPSYAPPPPSAPRFSAPQSSSQSTRLYPPLAGGTPSSWLRSIFNHPTPPSAPSAPSVSTEPSEEESEEAKTPFDFFEPLSETEMQAYKDAAKEKCLNILIASNKHGFYYNGEPNTSPSLPIDIHVSNSYAYSVVL